MKKRFVIWTFVLAAFAGLSVFLWQRQHIPPRLGVITDKDIAEAVARLRGGNGIPAPATITPIDMKQPLRLAIGGLGGGDDDQNRQLDDLVLTDLSGAAGLELVERRSLDKVLQELNLSISRLVRAQDAVRAGKLLKADWFLLGTGANINGTNFLVVRLVDSHTGILREAAVFSTDGSPVKLAAGIAGFVRQCRQDAAHPKPKVYLAIGTFQDLSLNNRQAAFPTQLRAYLTAAYQKSGLILLEREAADVLYQEVRMDLAGLTENGGKNPPKSLQSAYWLVDGDYQSYETTNFEVEVALRIHRMFGRVSRETLRSPPDQQLFERVKYAIDTRMRQDSSPIFLSLVSEASAQMFTGKELARLGGEPYDLIGPENYQVLDEQESAHRRRKAEEAIRAFETVLLLEPTNREAKLYLAACFRELTIGKVDEARNLYREILEEPVQDKWQGVAERALVDSFRWWDPSEKARWFEAAAQHATNPSAAEFFHREAEAAKAKSVLNLGGPKAQKLAEADLLRNITNAMLGNIIGEVGVDDFVKTFGTNQAAASQRLAELYPNWKAQVPDFAPYLLAAIVTVQVDTNAPVVVEFQQMLEKFNQHPDQVFRPGEFWERIWRPIYQWSYDHKLYAMSAILMEGKIHAAALYPNPMWGEVNNEQKMSLAFAYLRLEQWQKALGIFESYSNRPVQMGNLGPWGEAFTLVFTGKRAEFCRKKLGLSVEAASLEFDMGKPLLCLCTPSTFAADDNGLWIGMGGQLMQLDFDLKTNLVVRLPMVSSMPITALCLTSSSIWIGTAGEGLIEYDKSSHKCQRFAVNDGLMMNIISCMHLAGDVLWIGYGYKLGGIAVSLPGGGGLGCLNLSTHKFASFTPSIAEGTEAHKNLGGNMVLESTDKPTRRAVQAVAAGPTGEVWFATAYHPLRGFHVGENVWEGIPSIHNTSSFAVGADRIFAGQFWNVQGDNTAGPLGVSVLNLKDGQWQSLKGADGLPPGSVSTLTLDGNNLWVGGMGYIALVDPVQDKVVHFAYIEAQTVDRIQIGGGYVWAQFDWHLYRAPLSDLQ